jgi:argininosuccinate lyase
VEDVHSQVEFQLTKQLGDTGKKIHSARSRNDQVLLDLKLYLRAEIEQVVNASKDFFDLLVAQSEKYKDYCCPFIPTFNSPCLHLLGCGLGHMQKAGRRPDDAARCYEVVNKNPLGSAAGYGSSFPINRRMTTDCSGLMTSIIKWCMRKWAAAKQSGSLAQPWPILLQRSRG